MLELRHSTKPRGTCQRPQPSYRAAVTDAAGIVATSRVKAALGIEMEAPALPAWVQSWIDAEATRPWPPEEEPAFFVAKAG